MCSFTLSCVVHFVCIYFKKLSNKSHSYFIKIAEVWRSLKPRMFYNRPYGHIQTPLICCLFISKHAIFRFSAAHRIFSDDSVWRLFTFFTCRGRLVSLWAYSLFSMCWPNFLMKYVKAYLGIYICNIINFRFNVW